MGKLEGSFESFGLISGDKGNMNRGGGEINIIFEIGRGAFVTLGSLKKRRDRKINDYNTRVLGCEGEIMRQMYEMKKK